MSTGKFSTFKSKTPLHFIPHLYNLSYRYIIYYTTIGQGMGLIFQFSYFKYLLNKYQTVDKH